MKTLTKNRGTNNNLEGRFESLTKEIFYDGWDLIEEEKTVALDTILYSESAKSIISRNNSPDIGFEQSINPYKGCEHGCIYCYARPSHAYMNLSPGLDFETKIFYKENAVTLLKQELNKKNYICKPIVLGANTDPYQPAEVKLKLSRSILEVFNQFNHPVIIITKGSLILRDLDILTELANKNLLSVAVSITTLQSELKRSLEPRTSSPQARLRVIEQLAKQNISVRVMASPIIPMINDTELEKILENAANAGADFANYILVRLPYEVKELFKDWLMTHFPDRATHVMSIIKQMRGGKEYDASFGKRMRGEGEFANLLEQRFKIACKRFGLNHKPKTSLDISKFTPISKNTNSSSQLDLWQL